MCLYIAYLACGSASLYIKTLYFLITVLALSAAAIVANIKIRYDAKTPQFAILGTRVNFVFYSIQRKMQLALNIQCTCTECFNYDPNVLWTYSECYIPPHGNPRHNNTPF